MGTEQENQTEQTTEAPEQTEISSSELLPTSEESSEGTGLEFEEPDFQAITDFVEGDVEEVFPVVAEAEETVETPEEIVPPAEEAAAPELSESVETPEEVVEEPAVEEVVPVAAEEVVEQEPLKLPTREDLEGMYKDHREKTLPVLEQVFTLSDEEAAALDEQPSKVLPKLAAQLQYDVMLSTYNAIITALPSVMGTFNRANEIASSAHGQFMETWPDLNSKKAEPVVKASIQAYRVANPRATLEDTIRGAGIMAMVNLGLDPTPKSQQKPAVKAVRKVVPPKPVAPTGASPTPPVKGNQETNEFADLAEVFLSEMS